MATGLIIQAVLLVASTALTIQQQKRARRKQRKAAANDLRDTPSGGFAPIPYGRSHVYPVLAYYGVANTIAQDPAANIIGNISDRRSAENEFLMTQHVLGVGEISKVVKAFADEKVFGGSEIAGTAMTSWRPDGGTAEPAATAFNGDRSGTDKFTHLAYMTSFFEHKWKKPVFFGVPEISAIVEGRLVPAVTSTGSGARAYSPNLVRVLIDYVMAVPNIFGPGLAESDIDWPKMFAASEQADRIVQGAGTQDGEFSDPLCQRLGLNPADCTSYLAYLASHGYAPDQSGYVGSDQPDEIMRYEYNGQVGSDQNYPDAIEDIISPAPGAIAYWGRNGKFAVSLPDATRTEADQAGTNVIDDKILLAPVEIVYPDSSSKLNQLQVTFPDANEDYAESSITFPADNSVLHTQLLAEDGGVLLHRSISLDGIDNRYAATAAAYNVIMQSRRERYRCRCKPIAYLYEHGDKFRLIDPIQVIDVWARVTDTLVNEFLEIGIEAIRFDRDDYAYVTDDMQTVDTAAAIPDDLEALASVTAYIADTGDIRQILVTWVTAVNQLATTVGYDVEINRRATGAAFSSAAWEALTFSAEEGLSYRHPVPYDGRRYRYRARPVGSNGQRARLARVR